MTRGTIGGSVIERRELTGLELFLLAICVVLALLLYVGVRGTLIEWATRPVVAASPPPAPATVMFCAKPSWLAGSEFLPCRDPAQMAAPFRCYRGVAGKPQGGFPEVPL